MLEEQAKETEAEAAAAAEREAAEKKEQEDAATRIQAGVKGMNIRKQDGKLAASRKAAEERSRQRSTSELVPQPRAVEDGIAKEVLKEIS